MSEEQKASCGHGPVHDESCGCGCGHGQYDSSGHPHHDPHHDHAHDEGCGCDCDHQGHDDHHGHHRPHHHHGHDHSHAESVPGQVSIDNHEGALVATLQDSLTGDFTASEGTLSAWMEALAQRVSETGAVIGHIKAALCAGDTTSTLSTTGGPVNVTYSGRSVNGPAGEPAADGDARFTLVAIIFNIEGDRLRTLIMETRP